MTTIQIKVSEALVTRYGVKALQERVQREMEWEEMRLLAEEYQQSLQEIGSDADTVTEKARRLGKNSRLKMLIFFNLESVYYRC